MQIWSALPGLLVIASLGCGLLRAPEPPAPEPPPPERFLTVLEERAERIRSIRTIVRADVRSDEGFVRTRQVVIAEAPDRLRVDVLAPFGVSARIVAANGRLEAYDVNESVLYFGAASRRNMARLARLPIDPRDAVRLLAGLPPEALRSSRTDVLARDGGEWLLRTSLDENATEELVFDGNGQLRGAVLLSDGAPIYEIRFSRYETQDDIAMPMEIAVKTPPYGLSVELRHTRIEINPGLHEDDFRLDVPKSARRVDLDRD